MFFLATVFGDPHVYTFDHMDYTFNGLGEYVLVRADSPRVKIDVQVTHVYQGNPAYHHCQDISGYILFSLK